MDKKNNLPKHECGLRRQPVDILTLYIYTGWFIDLRRKIKRVTMISQDHPMTQMHKSSSSIFRHECWHHLIHHYYMIHPFSMLSFWFNAISAVSLSSEIFLWFLLMENAFTFSHQSNMFIGHNVINISAVVITFFTGYYEDQLNKVVFSQRLVAKRYLLTYFAFDVLSLLSYFYLILISYKIVPPASAESLVTQLMSFFVPMINFLRMPFIFETASICRIYFGLNQIYTQAIRLIIGLVFIVLMSNYMLLFGMSKYPHLKNRIKDAMHTSILTLLVINRGHNQTHTTFERIYPSIMIMIGFALHLVLFSLVMRWWKMCHRRVTSYSMKESVEAFNSKLGLPIALQDRIQIYLTFKHRKQFFKESAINNLTSDTLYEDVKNYLTMEKLKTIKILRDIPEDSIRDLLPVLKTETYLPLDIILRQGSLANEVFFIMAGTVDVSTGNGKHVCFLRDGDHFGDVELVTNMPRIANVMAITPSEVLRLPKRAFVKILTEFPDLLSIVQETSLIRVKATQRIAMFDIETFDDDQMAFWMTALI